MNIKKLALDLNKIGAVKFGEFKLKSGIISPIYIDLRLLISYPRILNKVAKAYLPILKRMKYDRLAAIPYTALPITGAISLLNKKPWIFTRKEQKDYGTKKLIEGIYKKGETVVLIDDLITTGGSKFESVEKLRKEGLRIKNVVVLIDRSKKGIDKEFKQNKLRLRSVLKIKQILEVLHGARKISQSKHTEVLGFLNS